MSVAVATWEDRLERVGEPTPADDFESFVADASTRLRRALVARYGVENGVEACAEATAWAWTHRDRLAAIANPVGYLYGSVRPQLAPSDAGIALRSSRRRSRHRTSPCPIPGCTRHSPS